MDNHATQHNQSVPNDDRFLPTFYEAIKLKDHLRVYILHFNPPPPGNRVGGREEGGMVIRQKDFRGKKVMMCMRTTSS